MARSPLYPISDRPAMPKKVWYTSAMSSGRSEMPPSSSSWQLRMKRERAAWSIQCSRPRMAKQDMHHQE